MTSPRLGLVLISFLCVLQLASARLRNFTIDDTYGAKDVLNSEPEYTGKIEWRALTGQNNHADCPECRLHPDPSQMFQGTWHDGTAFSGREPSNAAVTITFNGTAVYIFCALAGIQTGAMSETHLQFYIDGVHSGDFDHTPDGSFPAFEYDHLVFSAQGLPSGPHTVAIALRDDIGGGSVILFDYALFTADDGQPEPKGPTDEPPAPKPSNNVALKVGLGVGLGGGMLLAIGVLAWFLWLRKKMKERRWRSKANNEIPEMLSAIRNPDEATIVGDRIPWR